MKGWKGVGIGRVEEGSGMRGEGQSSGGNPSDRNAARRLSYNIISLIFGPFGIKST